MFKKKPFRTVPFFVIFVLSLFLVIIFWEDVFPQSDASNHSVIVRVLDENGFPTPARIRFAGLDDTYYAPEGHEPDLPVKNWLCLGGDVILDYGRRFTYIDGQFRISLPLADITVEAVKGYAYRILIDTLTVTPKTDTLDIRLERWFRFPDEDWYSGDVHVHLISPEAGVLESKAEDLNVCNILTFDYPALSKDLVSNQYLFIGKQDPVSEAKHIVYINQEYREDGLGHMVFLNLKKLISPVNTMRKYHYPLNLTACDEVHAQGGFTAIGHFSQFPGFEWPLGVIMRKVDALELFSVAMPFQSPQSGNWDLIPDQQGNSAMRLWYRLLNCGLRIPVVAGTDKYRKMVTLGANRVYACVDDSFTYENWITALKSGRSFITNSPFLFLHINGKMTGDSIHLKPGESLNIKADVWCQFPLDRLEIIANGEVIAEQFIRANGEHSSLSFTYTPRESCWITARAYESPQPHKKRGINFSHNPINGNRRKTTHFNRYYGTNLPEVPFAHTNPLYVTVGGKPIHSKTDAEYYVRYLDNTIQFLRTEGRFPSEEAKQSVLRQFEEGRQRFLDLSK